jgi:hypothetical protein
LPIVEKPTEKPTDKPTEKENTDTTSGSHGRTDSGTTNTSADSTTFKEPLPALKVACKPHVGQGTQDLVDWEAENLQNTAVGSSDWGKEYCTHVSFKCSAV